MNLGKETNPDPEGTERLQLNQPRRSTLRHIVIKMAKSRDQERILKARENSYIQGKPHKVINVFFNRHFAGQKGMA